VAERELGWKPRVTVREGLQNTVKYFRRELEETGEGVGSASMSSH
jgi:nucleoside-diphosphate-sugar epimerase